MIVSLWYSDKSIVPTWYQIHWIQLQGSLIPTLQGTRPCVEFFYLCILELVVRHLLDFEWNLQYLSIRWMESWVCGRKNFGLMNFEHFYCPKTAHLTKIFLYPRKCVQSLACDACFHKNVRFMSGYNYLLWMKRKSEHWTDDRMNENKASMFIHMTLFFMMIKK